MLTTIIVLIVIIVLVLAGLWLVRVQRSRQLRQRFGEEYDRTLERTGDRREAEQRLAQVAERRDALTLRALSPQERRTWLQQWSVVQARFVDSPAEAVATARDLLPALMRDRGYPVDDFEERASLLATDHPVVVSEYRAAEEAYQRHQASGGSSTESLRQALVHYRALFDALVDPRDEDRDAASADVVAADATADGARPDVVDVTDRGSHGRHADVPDADAARAEGVRESRQVNGAPVDQQRGVTR